MANTYIHTLPDSLQILDPAGYTIFDSKNQFDEYVTSRLSLSSLSDFVNGEYILTDEHLATKRATSWVNSNSSILNVNTLVINNSSAIDNINPLHIIDNRQGTSNILFENIGEQNLSKNEIVLRNSLSSNTFKIGTLGSNYNDNSWTIGERKNDAYILSENKNLLIGSQGFNRDLILFSGGPFTGNERIVIKGDGSGRIGINELNPNTTFSVNGILSTNNIIFSQNTNSLNWNQAYSYVLNNSSKNVASTALVETISSNLVFRTGATMTGTLFTTQTLTAAFGLDEFISRRYVDAVLLQATVSGNFVPALYYTKTEIESSLENPRSVYSFVNANSSLDLASRTFINSNSSTFLNLNTNVNQNSGKWESVYALVNQTSAAEEDQTEVTNFVILNSSRALEVQTYVNNTSGNINDLYSTSVVNSSLNLEARTFVVSNSAAINSNITLTNNNASLWSEGYTSAQTYSAQNINTNTLVNNNSANWNQSYTLYSNNSGTYATYQYVDNGFLPLSGGNVSGRLFAGSLGIGNTVSVAGTLGTLSRRVEIFDINGSSLGFIPVYGSIT